MRPSTQRSLVAAAGPLLSSLLSLAILGCEEGPEAWDERVCADEEQAFIHDKVVLAEDVSAETKARLSSMFGETYNVYDHIVLELVAARDRGDIYCGSPAAAYENEDGRARLGMAVPRRGTIYMNTEHETWLDAVESWREARFRGQYSEDEIRSFVPLLELEAYLDYRNSVWDFVHESSEPISTLVHEAAHLALPSYGHISEDEYDPNPGNPELDLIYEAGYAAHDSTYDLWSEASALMREVSPLDWDSVAAGNGQVCALTNEGRVACWGRNTHGQADAVQGTYVQIVAGTDFSCGLDADGRAVCWGRDEDGRTNPPDERYSQIAAGSRHACGIRTEDGAVSCWGKDSHGQASPPPDAMVDLGLGSSHSCGVLPDGIAVCWGDNTHQQTDVPEGDFLDVGGGINHSCGLLTDGTISCWGCSGSATEECAPPTSIGFVEVSSHGFSNHALEDSGLLHCWGHEDIDCSTVVETDLLSVSTGSSSVCGITIEQKVDCWGCDGRGYGQDGNFGQCETP